MKVGAGSLAASERETETTAAVGPFAGKKKNLQV